MNDKAELMTGAAASDIQGSARVYGYATPSFRHVRKAQSSALSLTAITTCPAGCWQEQLQTGQPAVPLPRRRHAHYGQRVAGHVRANGSHGPTIAAIPKSSLADGHLQ